MKNIAIFASGNGSNFEAIAENIANGNIKANLALMFCNKKNAYVIDRAKKYNVETLVLQLKDFDNKEEFERKVIEKLKLLKIDLICLAGYMLYIGPTLLAEYEGRIINIHPSLIPSFYQYTIKSMCGSKINITFYVSCVGRMFAVWFRFRIICFTQFYAGQFISISP